MRENKTCWVRPWRELRHTDQAACLPVGEAAFEEPGAQSCLGGHSHSGGLLPPASLLLLGCSDDSRHTLIPRLGSTCAAHSARCVCQPFSLKGAHSCSAAWPSPWIHKGSAAPALLISSRSAGVSHGSRLLALCLQPSPESL